MFYGVLDLCQLGTCRQQHSRSRDIAWGIDGEFEMPLMPKEEQDQTALFEVPMKLGPTQPEQKLRTFFLESPISV